MRVLIVAQSERDERINRARKVSMAMTEVSNTEIAFFDDTVAVSANSHPFLVIVLFPSNPGVGQEFIHRIRERYEGYILAVCSLADHKAIQRSLQIGADDILDETVLEKELGSVISRLLGRRPLDKSTGQCLCLVSASGGCGASTLAVNIAAVLATKHKQCVLVDLNPGGGDLPVLLDLKPQFSLVDLCLAESRLDQAMLDKTLVRHHAGIRLLGSPVDMAEMRHITSNGILVILEMIRKSWRHTVVDLAGVFESEQTAVLHQATGVMLVARLTFSSINNVRRLLKHMGTLEIKSERLKVIINQHGQPNELQLEDAEQALGIKLTYQVPYDPKTINAANNTGEPAVLREPGSRIAKCIAKLAELRFEA